jgi:hypothetical protein
LKSSNFGETEKLLSGFYEKLVLIYHKISKYIKMFPILLHG